MIPVHELCSGNRVCPQLSDLFFQLHLLPLYLAEVSSQTPVMVVHLEALPFLVPKAKRRRLLPVDMKLSACGNNAQFVPLGDLDQNSADFQNQLARTKGGKSRCLAHNLMDARCYRQ